MDDIGRRALLFDFYGPLLTSKQQEIYEYATADDMSLAEIAVITGVSRQAVYDMIRRTGNLLDEYERKLGLVEKFLDIENRINQIRLIIDDNNSFDSIKEAIINEINAIDLIERK